MASSCDWTVSLMQYISLVSAGGWWLSWTEIFGTLEMILNTRTISADSIPARTLLKLTAGNGFFWLTWCCAAWSSCPSPAPDVLRCYGPNAVNTCWPARLHVQTQRLHLLLSSSQTHSDHCRHPTSPRYPSSMITHILINVSIHVSLSQSQTTKSPYLYLLTNIFSFCHKAEVVACGFSW